MSSELRPLRDSYLGTRVDCEIKNITKEEARVMLMNNTENFRKPSKLKVRELKRSMEKGEWVLSGQPIIFGSNGKLLDGQHRLMALVASGVTCPFLIVTGILPEHAIHMDRGAKRTLSQWMAHKGYKNCTNLAACGKLALHYETGEWSKHVGNNVELTDNAIIEFVESYYEDLLSAVNLANHGGKIAPVSSLAAVLFIGAGKKDPTKNETCVWFADKLNTGKLLGDQEAVWHLRERLLQGKVSPLKKLAPPIILQLLTAAWNKTVLGEPTKQLRVIMAGPNKTKGINKILVAEQ